MTTPHLLSPNDYKAIQAALDASKPYQIDMTYRDQYHIWVSTVPVNDSIDVWNQSYIIECVQEYGHIYTHKYCRSAEELKRYLKGGA